MMYLPGPLICVAVVACLCATTGDLASALRAPTSGYNFQQAPYVPVARGGRSSFRSSRQPTPVLGVREPQHPPVRITNAHSGIDESDKATVPLRRRQQRLSQHISPGIAQSRRVVNKQARNRRRLRRRRPASRLRNANRLAQNAKQSRPVQRLASVKESRAAQGLASVKQSRTAQVVAHANQARTVQGVASVKQSRVAQGAASEKQSRVVQSVANVNQRLTRPESSKRPVQQKSNHRFARKIVEGMLHNVRGGARLIGARGNYGNVPLINKLIDNATLIRENIIDGFDCKGLNYGYYADQLNDCQIFHICVPMKQIFPGLFTDKDVYHFSFICPEYTIFSQDAMVCAWKGNAVPCEEAHNLYYMNQNFFVVSNDDVQRETTPATPSGVYPAPGATIPVATDGSGGYPAPPATGGLGGYPAPDATVPAATGGTGGYPSPGATIPAVTGVSGGYPSPVDTGTGTQTASVSTGDSVVPGPLPDSTLIQPVVEAPGPLPDSTLIQPTDAATPSAEAGPLPNSSLLPTTPGDE